MQKLWPFLFYAFYFAALSALSPFLALYYQSIGLTGAEIGLLAGLAPIVTLIGAPFWTSLADVTQRHKLVMSLTTLSVIALTLMIPSAGNFFWLLGLIVLYAFAVAPIAAFGDSATLSMLADEPHLYGRVRVGGTVGWGVMALFVGGLLEKQGLVWAFWIYAAGMGLTFLVSQKLVFRRARAPSAPSDARTFLRDPQWRVFLALVFIGGLGMASINTYLFVYMEEAGASKSLMGLTLTLSTLSELPVMFFGDWLLKRLRARGLLALALGMVGARLLLMAAFQTPLSIVLIQLVHGLTFPAMWIAGVSYAHEHAPAGLQSTAQGLFGAVMMGVGSGVGNFLGGLLLENIGARGLYFTFGLITLAGLLLLALPLWSRPAHSKSI